MNKSVAMGVHTCPCTKQYHWVGLLSASRIGQNLRVDFARPRCAYPLRVVHVWGKGRCHEFVIRTQTLQAIVSKHTFWRLTSHPVFQRIHLLAFGFARPEQVVNCLRKQAQRLLCWGRLLARTSDRRPYVFEPPPTVPYPGRAAQCI